MSIRWTGSRVVLVLVGLVAAAWLVAGYAMLSKSAGRLPLSGDRYPDCDADADASPGGKRGPRPDDTRQLDLAQALGDPRASGLGRWPAPIDVAPTAFDFDGDGTQELLAHSNDTHVYVFASGTGRALARIAIDYPAGWHIERILNGVEAGVLEKGQPPSIVVANHAACVSVWTFDPDASTPRSFRFEKAWERRLNDCFWNPGMDAKPSLADADGDGRLEIYLQTEEMGLFALDSRGQVLWHQCWAGGNAHPVLHDLDADGDLEAVFASDGGLVAVLDARTGAPQWTFDAADEAYGLKPASIAAAPTVAELDGRAPRELVFTVRHAPADDPQRFPEYHMAVFAIHQDPQTWQADLLWVRQPAWANPLSYARLAVHDLDGDGRQEVYGMDWNTIGHLPGNWERLGPAHLFRLGPDGREDWVTPLDTWWSNKDIAIADTDGDGKVEILANAPGQFSDAIWRIDPRTGEAIDVLEIPGWKLLRGPSLMDLRGDGRMQLVFPAEPLEAGDVRGAILVYELGVPYEAPWPGHPGPQG